MSILTKIRTLRHVRPAAEPDLPDVAHSVAIIMDGNARWARKRGYWFCRLSDVREIMRAHIDLLFGKRNAT